MQEIKYCEHCHQPIIDYSVRITHRNAIWLTSLSYLSKKAKDTDGYVHYSTVHSFVKQNFKGIVVSSYGTMALYPWLLMKPCEKNHKFKSNGYWKLTSIGEDFIHNIIEIPEIGFFNHEGCYRTEGLVNVESVLNCSFKELVEIYQSF